MHLFSEIKHIKCSGYIERDGDDGGTNLCQFKIDEMTVLLNERLDSATDPKSAWSTRKALHSFRSRSEKKFDLAGLAQKCLNNLCGRPLVVLHD